MKIQFPNLNVYKSQIIPDTFKNVSDKVIQIKNKTTNSIQNIDPKLLVDTLKHHKILEATALSTILSGMVIWALNYNPSNTPLHNHSTHYSEHQNKTAMTSSTLTSTDGAFSKGGMVFGVIAAVSVVVAGIFAYNSIKLPVTIPKTLKLGVLVKVAVNNDKFVRISQMRALSKLFNAIEWCESFQPANRSESNKFINSTIDRFTSIQLKVIRDFSEPDFKIWEENFIKLIASMFYEKHKEYKCFEMNETYIHFIKYLYEDLIEIEFKDTVHAGSTHLIKTQELSEEKKSYNDQDSRLTIQTIPDQNIAFVKAKVLSLMIDSEWLSRKTIASLLSRTAYKETSQNQIFQQIEKQDGDLDKDFQTIDSSKDSSKDLSKFLDIEKRSIELLSNLNYARKFYFKRCTTKEWQKKDIAHVEKLYRENVHQVLEHPRSSFSDPLTKLQRFSEFFSLSQFFNEFYCKPIFLPVGNPAALEIYLRKSAQLEEFKSKINNVIYILTLSDADLLNLKTDLIKLTLSWNPATGFFDEDIELNGVARILDELNLSALRFQELLTEAKQHREKALPKDILKIEEAVSHQDLEKRTGQVTILNAMLESEKPRLQKTLPRNMDSQHESNSDSRKNDFPEYLPPATLSSPARPLLTTTAP